MQGNRGLTCVTIVETSHIAIHAGDEGTTGSYSVDVYTCGDLNKDTVFESMQEFNPIKIDYKYLELVFELITIWDLKANLPPTLGTVIVLLPSSKTVPEKVWDILHHNLLPLRLHLSHQLLCKVGIMLAVFNNAIASLGSGPAFTDLLPF